jgi:hypothetical protein
MIVSELCSNGDLFDYIRNVHAPTLHKVVRRCYVSIISKYDLWLRFLAHDDARYC